MATNHSARLDKLRIHGNRKTPQIQLIFIGLKGFDYDTLSPETICIIPPDTVYNQWKDDYERMIQFMSYGEQPKFEDVIAYIKSLNDRLKTEL